MSGLLQPGENVPRGRRRERWRREWLAARIPLQWLLLDAALAAPPASLAITLLLYLLNPEPPLTLGGFLATWVALAPVHLLVLVLTGPALVALAVSLRFGRTTGRGLRLRYVMRFGLLDAVWVGTVAVIAVAQYGPLLPAVARWAGWLLIATCALCALALAVLAAIDLRAPGSIGAPPVLAIGLVALLTLGVIADLRRVRPVFESPIPLPGFTPTRTTLVIELPGLDRELLDRLAASGGTPALERLIARGALTAVDPGPVAGPLAVHTTLLSGRLPPDHGILGATRYRPRGGSIAFALLPRGLFMRRLAFSWSWELVPYDHEAVRTVVLPGIARALGLRLALLGEPLRWPSNAEQLVITDAALRPPTELMLAGSETPLRCAATLGGTERFFGGDAPQLAGFDEQQRLVAESFGVDQCVLAAARQLLDERRFDLIWVRLPGFARLAERFGGWRDDRPARATTEREIEAFGRTLPRMVRALDDPLGGLIDRVGAEGRVLLVSPQAVKPRHDLGRLIDALRGVDGATATWSGPSPGVAVFAGPGIARGVSSAAPLSATSLLPTLLWSLGLPTAQAMGPLWTAGFDPEFQSSQPVVAVPSFGASAEPGAR